MLMTHPYTPAQLEAWAGLGPWDVTKSAWDERHYVEGENTICYMYALREDDHAILHCENHETNAALIAAAPDLARLVLEKEKEIARLKAAALDLVSLCSADVKMNGTTYQPMPNRSAFTKAVEHLLEAINSDRQAMKETSDE